MNAALATPLLTRRVLIAMLGLGCYWSKQTDHVEDGIGVRRSPIESIINKSTGSGVAILTTTELVKMPPLGEMMGVARKDPVP
jgi:hypothetical protein